MSQSLLFVLAVLVVERIYAATLIKNQYFPLPTCPDEAVCSEIYELTGTLEERLFYNVVMCRCPTGRYCPTEPGKQTLSVNAERWYGICRPVSDLDSCEPGDVAEEVLIGAKNFGGKTYTSIHCTCPRHQSTDMEEGSYSTAWSRTQREDPRAKIIYELLCMEDVNKRGGRFGGKGNRRFYFYRR
ncbi:hypothetical protein ScPMuIL_018690 [Solemya velum]